MQISQIDYAEEEEKYYGANAKRQRKEVDYSDNLTEKQWLKVCAWRQQICGRENISSVTNEEYYP